MSSDTISLTNTISKTLNVDNGNISFYEDTLPLEKDSLDIAREEAESYNFNFKEEPHESNVLLKEYKSVGFIKAYTYLFIKRAFDVACSLIGVTLMLPILLIVKIAFLITGDTKSIFYTQKRIGRFGKVFNLIKIRSMVPNSAEILKELLKDEKYRKEWEENQKFENDPRITKVGKIIRKTSIDELPQFINILKGDMSLIGPRPLVQGELDQHEGNHEIYESVRPGLTGWWGCNGRSATTYEERLNLEYYYVLNASLGLDIKTIFKTVKVILKAEGAK